MGGRTYVKEEEKLTRTVLLERGERHGAVREANLTPIKLDDTANSVSCLKQIIQNGQGSIDR